MIFSKKRRFLSEKWSEIGKNVLFFAKKLLFCSKNYVTKGVFLSFSRKKVRFSTFYKKYLGVMLFVAGGVRGEFCPRRIPKFISGSVIL
jgi:hypothetical protein